MVGGRERGSRGGLRGCEQSSVRRVGLGHHVAEHVVFTLRQSPILSLLPLHSALPLLLHPTLPMSFFGAAVFVATDEANACTCLTYRIHADTRILCCVLRVIAFLRIDAAYESSFSIYGIGLRLFGDLDKWNTVSSVC